MEYQNIIILLENTPDQTSNFRIKIGLKYKMNHVELKTLIVNSNPKFQG